MIGYWIGIILSSVRPSVFPACPSICDAVHRGSHGYNRPFDSSPVVYSL